MASLCGCNDSTGNFDDKVKVIYQLEGGLYQNCEEPVIQYYDFKGSSGNLIVDLTTLSGKEITRSGYTFEGWYTTKKVNGDEVSYEDEWNFTSDTVPSSGITLYAKWKKALKHTYEICYRDENSGEAVVLGSYEVDAGDKLLNYDVKDACGKRYGYTWLGMVYDENGQLWEDSFTHPGGEVDTSVRVFVEFIKGDYALVGNADDLVKNKGKNIYLTANIDFEGEEFYGFGDYKGVIEGNGYTIKNFKLAYDNKKTGLIKDEDLSAEGDILCIALFTSINKSTISNLTVSDFTIDINVGFSGTKLVLVAPLAVKAENSEITNVSVSNLTITCSKLPVGFDKESSLIVLDDQAVYFTPDGDTSGDSVTVEVDNKVDEE